MKTTTKILILLAAMAAVFIAVMFFLQNLGTPPSIPDEDVYEKELNQYLNNSRNYKTFDEADAHFFDYIRCAEIFHQEKKITSSRCDDFIDGVMRDYMRLFGGKWYADNKFTSSWTEKDIIEASARVKKIEGVRHTNGTSPCGDYQLELNKLKDISKNYWEAKKVWKNYQFRNLKDAEKTVNNIRKYRNDAYLKNCGELAKGLDRSIESLNKSHFDYVKGKLGDLRTCVNSGTFKAKSKTSFETNYLKPAKDAATEYNVNAKKLYGEDKGVSSLILEINELEKKANDYYNRLNSGTSSGYSSGTSSGSSTGLNVSKSGTINGHDYVDLGLSVKWATCNVGASTPSGYGYYYAWGETKTKSDYTPNNIGSYVNSRTADIGGWSQYDAASAAWGGTWRMPSKLEFEELVNKCKWVWTKYGYRITGPNGNSIFLPVAGFKSEGWLYSTGVFGYYWSSTPNADRAFCCVVSSNVPGVKPDYKYKGFSVRPVSR